MAHMKRSFITTKNKNKKPNHKSNNIVIEKQTNKQPTNTLRVFS